MPQTLYEWFKKAEIDSGKRGGIPTADKLKALERKVHELRQANEILRKASAYLAQAELDALRPPSNDAVHRRNLVGKQVLRPLNPRRHWYRCGGRP